MKRLLSVTAVLMMVATITLASVNPAMSAEDIKKITLDQVKPYEVAKHFKMIALKLHGKDESGSQNFWVGMSHFLPGGGAEWGASALEKIYFVLEGEVAVKSETQEFVLGPWDSIYIGPDVKRDLINKTNKTATMLVIMPYPK